MALEVAEGAVVGDDLEPVRDRLVAAARPVAAVARGRRRARKAASRARPAAARAAPCGSRPRKTAEPSNISAASRSSSDPRTDTSRTAGPVASTSSRAVEPEPARPAIGGLGAVGQVLDPLAAAVGPVDPRDEARHHRLELLEDRLAVHARLGQRRRQQVHDELLVGLAAREDPHVRQRRGGQQPAQQVERLGLDRARVRRLGDVGRPREALRGPRLHARQRIGVGVEQPVHRPRVFGPELGRAPVAVAGAAGHRLVVGDVARRLLQVRRQPRPLEHLGHHVRNELARDVRSAELRDRVVAVADEDALVERRGALALAGVERGGAAGDVVGELIQEQPAQRPGVARVAREQRPLDGLRHVDQAEDGAIQIGEVRRHARLLFGGELLDRVIQRAVECRPRIGGFESDGRHPLAATLAPAAPAAAADSSRTLRRIR